MKLIEKTRAVFDLRRRMTDHPLTRAKPDRAILRMLRYQAGWRLTREASIHPWIGDSRLIVGPGMTGVTPEVYLAVAEFVDCAFLAHLLRPEDLLVDVGANAGTYSVLAARVAGARAIAVEPIPATVAHLRDNLRLNDIADRVEVVQSGVSDRTGTLRFTTATDALNRVTDDPSLPTMDVPVTTLDAIVGMRAPLAIKIDVEGHERAVIAGAQHTLGAASLQVLVIETGVENRDAAFVDSIRRHGFEIVRYDPERRRLTPATTADVHNTLFVRDRAWVEARLASAAPVRMGDRSI